MDKSDVLQIFNNQFKEFVENISESFPKNTTLSRMKTVLNLLIVVKPNILYKGFKKFVIDVYRKEIESGDITFFIDNDYKQDLNKVSGTDSILNTGDEYATFDSDSNSILEKIEALKGPVREMNPKEQQNAMKYIQNLMKLSDLYETR